MDWKKSLGINLHNLRRERRLTLREVARQVHVNYTDISKLERGERPQITFEAVLKLATFYDVGLDLLLQCPPSAQAHHQRRARQAPGEEGW